MRWWAVSLFLLGCASAPPVVVRAPPAPTRAVLPPAPRPVARPLPLEERALRAKREAEQSGGEILAEHRARLDGEARLHLVLEQDRCYRAWVGAERAVRARLEDEHGHTIASGSSEDSLWLGESPLCPRWSGSFALVVEGAGGELAVLLVGAE